ncbi:MAG: hypothetical protein MJ252_29435 [archaeon]|nr:hypothetical protein [archaeon]
MESQPQGTKSTQADSPNYLLSHFQSSEEKISNFLRDKKVYIDIKSEKPEDTSKAKELLKKFNVDLKRSLSKNLDYIIYHEGRPQTLEYALNNNIKVVNLLWLDDKENGILMEDSKYLIPLDRDEINLEVQISEFKPMEKKMKDIQEYLHGYSDTPKHKKKNQPKTNVPKKGRGQTLDKFVGISSFNQDCDDSSLNSTTFQSDNRKKEEPSENERQKRKIKKKTLQQYWTEDPQKSTPIKVTSYGLNQDLIDYLKSSKYLDYEEIEFTNENFEEKCKSMPKFIFIPNTFDEHDPKIISFITKYKTVINTGAFINEIGTLSDDEININFVIQCLDKTSFTNNKFIKKNPSPLPYSFFLAEGMGPVDKNVCLKVISEVFGKTVSVNPSAYLQMTLTATDRPKNKVFLIDVPKPPQTTQQPKKKKKTKSRGYSCFGFGNSKKSTKPGSKDNAPAHDFDATLSIDYIFDSFYKRNLLELNEENLKKYQIL